MAEYIERETLQKALQQKKAGVANKRYTEGWNDCLLRMKSMVHGAKSADVAPVVHGEWENHPHAYGFERCSVCHDCTIWGEWADGKKWNFCPNCGAKMDGERKGDDEKEA